MADDENIRPDPEALLRTLRRTEEREGKGKLKIFFGMCAGVGKTYKMLQAGHDARRKGIDIVIGLVETHGRRETEMLVEGLALIPRRQVEYRGTKLEEMDIDAIIARNPALVLIDELAHTNAPDSRHTKRFLDVIELLDSGIDVYTTLNVQHLESHADTVAQITGSIVRETVPDSIFERANEVEVIDLPPDELLRRLAEGKVYTPERSQRAVQNFFKPGNLTALREMALRLAAERVEHQLLDLMQSEQIKGPWKSGQRLVVGVTPSRDSVRLIRWTRRLAFTMRAGWIAVFVERATSMSDAAKEQFARNIALARELGAEIVTTADQDIAAALVRVAREQNATQIIVGRSNEHRPFRKTIVDRLIALADDIDIYVTTGEEESESPRRRSVIRPDFQSGLPQYAAAAGLVLIVSALCYPFAHILGYQTVSLVLLLAVTLLPLRFGIGPVILAAVLSALTWNFFFIPPTFTLVIGEPRDIVMELTYVAVVTVTSMLTTRIRSRERAVRLREQRATALYALTNDLSSAKNQNEVAEAAVHSIRRFFDADVAIFLSDLDGDFVQKPHAASTYSPSEKDLSVPAWVHWNEKKAGKFTETLPFADATYYSLAGPRYPLGVVGVKPRNGQRLELEQETLLGNFLSQIASALEREFLNELARKSVAIAESERLSTTLFNSISHEIRTPVTTLLGLAESLLEERFGEEPSVRRELLREIQSAAERLDNFVQNLLAMTRLESGRLQPRLDWTDLRDVVNSAVGKLQKELNGHTLTIEIPADLPLLRLDFVLFEQALINLLHNAAVHTPKESQITLRASQDGSRCSITLEDNGPGFPPEALPRAFDKFFRGPGSKPGGVGLGLSIALGFVEAHRGTLTLENRSVGGARFTIQLPVESPGAIPAAD